jgi:enoyl-CoA hydratase/carnithine racemase
MQVMASLLPILPARKVLDLCMRGKVLNAQQALDWGIITDVVPANQLDEAVQKLADEICENAPAAIRMGLEAFDALRAIPAHEAHAYLRSQLTALLKTADSQEGIKAFMEKRKPNWTGE